jgi:hypothetical protein
MNEEFKEGERVYCFGFGYQKDYGTIHKNTEYPNVSEWYIRYDDGEECAVVDERFVFKVKEES